MDAGPPPPRRAGAVYRQRHRRRPAASHRPLRLSCASRQGAATKFFLCFFLFPHHFHSLPSLPTSPRAQLPSNPARFHPQAALYNDPKSAEDMGALFTDGFHPKLKGGGYLTSTPHRLFSCVHGSQNFSTPSLFFVPSFSRVDHGACTTRTVLSLADAFLLVERESERLCRLVC